MFWVGTKDGDIVNLAFAIKVSIVSECDYDEIDEVMRNYYTVFAQFNDGVKVELEQFDKKSDATMYLTNLYTSMGG